MTDGRSPMAAGRWPMADSRWPRPMPRSHCAEPRALRCWITRMAEHDPSTIVAALPIGRACSVDRGIRRTRYTSATGANKISRVAISASNTTSRVCHQIVASTITTTTCRRVDRASRRCRVSRRRDVSASARPYRRSSRVALVHTRARHGLARMTRRGRAAFVQRREVGGAPAHTRVRERVLAGVLMTRRHEHRNDHVRARGRRLTTPS
jgi:hypothetical protein